MLNGSRVLIGKHAAGEYEGLYGIASTNAATDRRPQRTAARLAEWTSLGLLGTRNDLEYLCKLQGRSAFGMRVYAMKSELAELPSLLRGAQSYITSSFPFNAVGERVIPAGLFAWRDTNWYTGAEALALRLDPVSRDAVILLQTKALRTEDVHASGSRRVSGKTEGGDSASEDVAQPQTH